MPYQKENKMFLSALKKQNQRLIESALILWKKGDILPDTYVIDLDKVIENGKKLIEAANKYHLSLYIMGKQFGRNAYVYRELLKLGFAGIVAVDYKEARVCYKNNLPVAHIGHLVQCPDHYLEEIIKNKPEVITVYSLEKAEKIASIAKKLGITQKILIKVYDSEDIFYSGQESGIALTELPAFISKIIKLEDITLAGFTHFPCLLSDENYQIKLTPNFHSLLKAQKIAEPYGLVEQINAPSSTCVNAIPLLSQMGATHGEPGHALTGTFPANQNGSQPEEIAMLYLSEISHHFLDYSYCYGGGYYHRGHLQQALVGEALKEAEVLPMQAESIDYTLRLKGHFAIGSPVIMCFRTQIFVTRSDVALVHHNEQGEPELVALYDSLGNLIKGASNE